jgi:hypothetical protein
VHVREDARDLDGVKDVRLTAAPVLALVRLGAEQVGAIDLGNLRRAQIRLEQRAQIADVKAGVRGRRRLRRWGRFPG